MCIRDSFTTLAELMKSQEEETRKALNISRNVPSSSSTNNTGSQSTPVMPYVSLADWLDNFFTKLQGSSLEASLPKLLTETQQMLQTTSDCGETSSTSDTATKAGDGGQLLITSSTPMKPQEAASTTPASPVHQSSSAGSAKEEEEGEGGGTSSVASQIFKATAPFVKNDSSKVEDVGGSALDSVDKTDTPKSKHSQSVSAEVADKSNSSTSLLFGSSLLESCGEDSQGKSQTTGERNENEKEHTDGDVIDIGAQILQALVMNWPGIVTTVLGFCPPCVSTSCGLEKEQSGDSNGVGASLSRENVKGGSHEDHHGSNSTLEFSSVHSLDSFTFNLILNCDDSTVDLPVDTIVSKMNTAVLNSTDCGNAVDLSILLEGVDFTKPPEELCTLNDGNVSLLVGRRFVNSVVRLLGLEHSRVKNAFVEMQQMRQSNAGTHIA